ncbi:MAG: SMC-Scp complex subunit ScpB [Candidatus Accumulibacter sp.]|jgi:segregation and condensation protein B|nr:SMC-Scp complex subunit ScpB [Accumulibacter sp.]
MDNPKTDFLQGDDAPSAEEVSPPTPSPESLPVDPGETAPQAEAETGTSESFETLVVEATVDASASAATPENPKEIKNVLEAVLLSAQQALTLVELRKVFANEIGADTLRVLLDELRTDYAERPLDLLQIAGGWRFRTKPEFMPYIARLDPEKTLRYSRAVLETLAIIAYRQPVTRGDIEGIRGVSVSSQILRALEERGWIETVGHRDTPGHPALLATTEKFLDDLGLRSLSELPPLETFDQALNHELDLSDAAQNA